MGATTVQVALIAASLCLLAGFISLQRPSSIGPGDGLLSSRMRSLLQSDAPQPPPPPPQPWLQANGYGAYQSMEQYIAAKVAIREVITRPIPEPSTAMYKPADGWTKIHPDWVIDFPCQYGEMPGTWLPEMGGVIADHENVNHTIIGAAQYLPLGISNVTHGQGWQLLDPDCQLQPFLRDYLTLRRPDIPEAEKDLNILFIGDSVDRHHLYWYGSIIEHAMNGTAEWEQVRNKFQWTPVNYARGGNGLNFFYEFLGTLYENDDEAIGQKSIDSLVNDYRARIPEHPDVISINSAFWDLHEIHTNKGGRQDIMVLPPGYLQHFMESMERTLLELRKQFPKAYIMWRTAGQTRTTLEDGTPGAFHKEWAYKMHIAQINSAARHVAKKMNVPLIDLSVMDAGLTPAQLCFDIHHPRDWFAMAYVNVVLNAAMQWRREKGWGTR